MAPARHVIVAGAGIAGLTAALAMARAGIRVTVFEQSEKLEEAGAGVQLSLACVLIAMGLGDRLASVAVKPQAIRVMAGGSGREIVRIPSGKSWNAVTVPPIGRSIVGICNRRSPTLSASSST